MVTAVFRPEPVVSAGLMEDIATALSEKYEVIVIKPLPSRPQGFKIPEYNYEGLSYRVIEVESYRCPESKFIGRYRETKSFGRAAARYIKEHHDEIDFIYNDCWWLWGVNMVAKKAVKYGIPYITPVQDVYPEAILNRLPTAILKKIAAVWLGRIDRYTLQHASKVHTIGQPLVDYLSRTRDIPKERFVLVRNWQDERRFTDYVEARENDTPKNSYFIFMFLGSVGKATGLETVIKAFDNARLSNAKLMIAGNGNYRDEYIRYAKSLGNENVFFCDAPFDQVPAIQSKADVLLLPLKKGIGKTSIPSKLPAYMFSSKPVLASVDTDSDVASCIREAQAGWICEPECLESLTLCMKKVYQTSKEELVAMGKRGFDYSIQHFSKKVNLPIIVKACEDVIERDKHRALGS